MSQFNVSKIYFATIKQVKSLLKLVSEGVVSTTKPVPYRGGGSNFLYHRRPSRKEVAEGVATMLESRSYVADLTQLKSNLQRPSLPHLRRVHPFPLASVPSCLPFSAPVSVAATSVPLTDDLAGSLILEAAPKFFTTIGQVIKKLIRNALARMENCGHVAELKELKKQVQDTVDAAKLGSSALAASPVPVVVASVPPSAPSPVGASSGSFSMPVPVADFSSFAVLSSLPASVALGQHIVVAYIDDITVNISNTFKPSASDLKKNMNSSGLGKLNVVVLATESVTG
ncbi:uncharacterized protein BYT42DRAFT_541712 [Radiomyces spectabilis]|uniref:uncharacterized protein n=1 Tax=Radiomyces spectabilis TaxID=64574 RepID=UPI00221FF0E5|nr:uncharacterized protein BYT42DRAFT_541712 [Radiomyces spectabilis]KAI8393445.1 hypothetical protein BYT42DRAFT_541712 [Radiomyces spectabilis]